MEIEWCLRVIRDSINSLVSVSFEDSILVNDNLEAVLDVLDNEQSSAAAQAANLIRRAMLHISDGFTSGHAIGRPKLQIQKTSLEYMLSLNFKATSIAKLFGVSRRTLHRRMNELNLSVSDTYSRISEEQLYDIVRDIITRHHNTGFKRLRGFLADRGIKVTTMRTLNALRTVDPAGVEVRRSQNRAIYRRQYHVTYSNEVWHIDTHHKLIRWGIVVRGGIDGKSRTIVYLDVGTDNTAASNLENFRDGVSRFGIPLRTRSDKGGENVEIARFMIEARGVGRGSHICGRSVHNQRIERLWRDVHYGCLHVYRNVFMQLEEDGYLDIDNPRHIALLQHIFVPRIRRSLYEFMNAWNVHPISSENNKTPLQIMLTTLPPREYDIGPPAPEEFPDLEGLEIESIVEVESFNGYLTSVEIETLSSIDLLAESNSFGMDIYIAALQRIGNGN